MIKYNTLIYKHNTTTTSETIQQEDKYNALRMKSPNANLERSRGRSNHTPNSDIRGALNETENFMIKQDGVGSEPRTVYIDDNCENKNPNYLRDPRLTHLENENRLLKEELKKHEGKAKFYKTKYKQLKAQLKNKNAQNWAS